jgi:hypothetical protein
MTKKTKSKEKWSFIQDLNQTQTSKQQSLSITGNSKKKIASISIFAFIDVVKKGTGIIHKVQAAPTNLNSFALLDIITHSNTRSQKHIKETIKFHKLA